MFAGMSGKEQLLGALFSAVTPRTAGFNSVDTAAMKESSKFLTMVLMFIGGSSGSTAGGVKVTTAVVMLLSTIAMIRGTHGVNILNRRLEEDTVKKASAIVTIDLSLAVAAALIIMAVQPLKLTDTLFEVFSAIGTVGMTTGVTRELVPVSRIVIILLMYCGRLEEAWRYAEQGTAEEPDYPWMDTPESAVFRHEANRKWFALVTTVPKSKLGLPGQQPVDIVNLKCDPILIGSLRAEPGFYPAYHMNKENWITAALDGSAPEDKLRLVLDMSYTATAPKLRKKKA